ncbi:NUDIX domain-containing protein [Paraflavisolibacter sp. H34]|uniref:NUDIX hydrolase n=1 Tax=Huijunlia imazamoxiresistens TaxID=3127457 RepID=UPI0030181711
MIVQAELEDFLRNGDKYYLPNLTIDCVIFGYHDQQLKILLAKYAGLKGWGLPGGFIKNEETLIHAATRILWERTSLENIYLQQFYIFGDNSERMKGWRRKYIDPEFLEVYGEDNWLLRRTVSVGYYALIDYSKAELKPDFWSEEFDWHSVNGLPDLLFDHNEMVEKALETLRNQIHLKPIGLNLLPEKFTLTEIHVLYETILNKKLDRRNFINKLTALDLLVKLEEKRKIGQHRSPTLYKFNEEKYQEALKNGMALAF